MTLNEFKTFMCGYNVVTDYALGKWVQTRRHKKKRINKKWLKRFGFKSVPDCDCIIVRHDMMTIFMHPATWEKIKKQLNGGDKL